MISLKLLVLSLIVTSFLLIVTNAGDHHHPQTLEDACRSFHWHHNHQQKHLMEMRWRACANKFAEAKVSRRNGECLKILDLHDDSITDKCREPSKYQGDYEKMKTCFKETSFAEDEKEKIMGCMRDGQGRREKRSLYTHVNRVDKFEDICKAILHDFYMDHPSWRETLHMCFEKTIGPEKFQKMIQCHEMKVLKTSEDLSKCKDKAAHEADYQKELNCFKENMLNPEEREKIMNCTQEALEDLDLKYALKSLLWDRYDNYGEFCKKMRKYWRHDWFNANYRTNMEMCAVQANPEKYKAHGECETLNMHEESIIAKCANASNYEEEFNKMKSCFGANNFTEPEMLKYKECMSQHNLTIDESEMKSSEVESFSQACEVSTIRIFHKKIQFFDFLAECTKTEIGEEKHKKYVENCGEKLGLKTVEEMVAKCQDSGSFESIYQEFLKCRQENKLSEEEMVKVTVCATKKMGEHWFKLRNEGEDEEKEDKPEQ